jgi:hypothetical protein
MQKDASEEVQALIRQLNALQNRVWLGLKTLCTENLRFEVSGVKQPVGLEFRV